MLSVKGLNETHQYHRGIDPCPVYTAGKCLSWTVYPIPSIRLECSGLLSVHPNSFLGVQKTGAMAAQILPDYQLDLGAHLASSIKNV